MVIINVHPRYTTTPIQNNDFDQAFQHLIDLSEVEDKQIASMLYTIRASKIAGFKDELSYILEAFSIQKKMELEKEIQKIERNHPYIKLNYISKDKLQI